MQIENTNIFNTIPTYFPSIAWYANAVAASEIYLQCQVMYNRKWFANRAAVSGANGKQILSIPLVGGRMHKAPFSEMQISYETDWQKNHWRSLETMYRKSPYFEYYELDFQKFFQTKFASLQECNVASILLINTCLQVKLPLVLQPQNQSHIALGMPESKIVYTQVFANKQTFVPDLSMLDMLFCCGPSSVNMLKNI